MLPRILAQVPKILLSLRYISSSHYFNPLTVWLNWIHNFVNHLTRACKTTKFISRTRLLTRGTAPLCSKSCLYCAAELTKSTLKLRGTAPTQATNIWLYWTAQELNNIQPFPTSGLFYSGRYEVGHTTRHNSIGELSLRLESKQCPNAYFSYLTPLAPKSIWWGTAAVGPSLGRC